MAKLHTTRMGWVLFLTFTILGFLLVAQFRTHEQAEADLSAMGIDDLSALLGTLSKESERLQVEITELRLQLLAGQYARRTDAEMVDERRRTFEELQLVTGAVPGTGPGVYVRVSDAQDLLGPYEMCELVNELRVAAARAIAVNGRRVDFNTGFSGGASGIWMSGSLLTSPYEVVAVGHASELHSALLMPGGVATRMNGLPGVTVEVERRTYLEMPRAVEKPPFEYAVRVMD